MSPNHMDALMAFAGKLQDPKYAIDELMGDIGMVSDVNAVFGGGAYAVWVLILGMDVAMKLSFLMGAAWQRELDSMNNPKLGNLLNGIDINLD